MSYCAFRNTISSLIQCKMILADLASGEDEKLSKEESDAAISLFETMQEMVHEMKDLTNTDDSEALEGERITNQLQSWDDQKSAKYDWEQ